MFPELGMFDNSLGMFSPELNPLPYPSLNLDFTTGTLDSRITFTRASTGTYYDGSTVMAEQNLLKYSQDLNNTIWVQTRATISANSTTAPDGTTTAETLIED